MPLTEAQLAVRKSILTASDVAAVLGLSPWESPLDVYLKKTSDGPPWAGNYRTRRGDALEPLLIRELGAQLALLGLEVQPAGGDTLVDPVMPWLGATLDAIVLDGGTRVAVGEAKAPGDAGDWIAEDGAWTVPEYYAVQVQTQMLVARVPVAYVAADLPREAEPVVVRIEADRDLQASIAEVSQIFVEEHLRARVPPTDGESYERLARLYAKPKTEALEPAPPEVDAWAREFLEIRAAMGDLEKESDALKAKIAAATGDRLGWKGEGWRLSWRPQDEVHVAAHTRKATRVFDLKQVAEKKPKSARARREIQA